MSHALSGRSAPRPLLTPPRACTQVRITADKENKLLIIEDSGVGLTKEEMIANLGRIAQSGTKQFAEMLKAKERKKKEGEDDMNLIGQVFFITLEPRVE